MRQRSMRMERVLDKLEKLKGEYYNVLWGCVSSLLTRIINFLVAL